MIRVWDPFVRAFHWALAASFAVAWLSSENWEGVHDAAGYAAGALVALADRLGLRRPATTRASPSSCDRRKTVIAYLRAMKDGSERRYVGHNPAGGAMIVVLLAAMAATAVSGWLLTTDAFWGSTAVQHVHSLSRTACSRWWSFISAACSWRACAIVRIWFARWSSASSARAGPGDVA